MKLIYKVIGYVFHPVFVPALVMAYLLMVSHTPELSVAEGNNTKWLLIVAYSTIVFPLLVTFLLWRMKFIESMEMKNPRERYIPLIASMLFYFWVFWVFHKSLDANRWFQIFLLGNFLIAVFTFLGTLLNKVSLHTAAYVGVFLYVLFLNSATQFQDTPLLLMATVCIIVIPYSRYQLGAHDKKQLILGAICGAIPILISILIL